MQTAHAIDSTPVGDLLTVSLELAGRHWKLALHGGKRERPAVHTTMEEGAAERVAETVSLIETAKHNWQLAEPVRVVVLYEAGQDGFWICRALERAGYEVVVTDPASIPVERQARRAKTDRLDALRLLSCLRGWLRGERDRLHAVRVPAPEDSKLARWYRDRVGLSGHPDRGKRLKRIAVVAVARRLVIALWRYVKDGVVPEGATFTVRPRTKA